MIDQEILQPNPQNAQQDTDWAKVYGEYYDKGFSLIKAKRKLKTQYPDVWKDHKDGLISFYESKKKIQEDTSQSDSSSEEVSTVSTSDTDQQNQQDGGDSVSTTQPTKLDTIVGIEPTAIPTYQLASAEVVFDTDQDYIAKFGEGPIFKLNPNRLLSEQKDPKIFTDLQLLEESSFDRWYNKTVSEDPRLASNIEAFLSSPENAMLKGHIDLGLPLHYVKDGILDMLAALDGRPDEFDESEGEVRSASGLGRFAKSSKKDMTPGERFTGQRIQGKTMRRLEKSYNDFFRDMVFQSLPQSVRLDENKLKDLEYYFKLGSDNLFDFTGDKEIGNKTWWQDGLTSAELGGMTFTNKLGYLGSRFMGFFFDTIEEGLGDPFREGFDAGVAIREKEMEDMRAKMNSYEESISGSLSNFFETGDLTSLNNYFEQSFMMASEASPQIAAAIGAGVMGMGPTGIALMLTADGIATEAYTISNDISFDDFVDKESGERLTYYEALANIPVNENDTMESLEEKLRVMYDIETNHTRRGIYLGAIGVTDFVADRVTFGIAARAMKKTNFNATRSNIDFVKNLLIGSGVAIPESAIPTFLSAWNRELQKQGQTGDPNWDAYEAFERALDVTLGTLPVGPGMHVGGTSLGYIKHLANSRIGKDGMNAQQRKLLETLQETADNPHISSKERTEALQLINQIKKEGRARARKDEAFYEYVGRRSQGDLDQITNIDLRLQRFARQYESTKNPELKILIKNKMAELIKMRNSIESKYTKGFESSYDVTFREPVSGREYTVKFDEEGGIVPPKDDANTKPKDDADADPDADPEAPPVITPDDANRKAPDEIEEPLEGEPRNNDTPSKVEEEEGEVATFKGGWLRKLFRETFRTDAGVGGSRPGRGLAFWKKRKYEEVSELILAQQRLSASLRTQIGMDLGMLDVLFQDLKFDVNGKKISNEEYARRTEELNKYMKGDPNAKVAFLDEAMKAKVDYLRGRIDAATDDIIRLLEENPTEKNKALVELLKSNKGHYLKRSYEAFTDNGTWLKELSMRFDEMPADKKALFDGAIDFIMSQEGFTGTRLEARKMVTSYIQDINRKIASGDFAYGSGTIGALDTKMFAGRKDIPEPFRKLLGEIDDVNFNYVNTMHRLTGYVSDLQYQKSLRQSMLDLGLASEASQQGLVPLETGKAYSGLDGLYVDPVFKQMYDSMMPVPVSPSKFWRTIHGIQGMVKIGKTQYSPTTTSRNLISGVFLGLNSGHFFLSNPNAIAMAKDLAWGDPNVVNQNKRLKEATLDLIAKGVLADGARATEALKMLRDWSQLTEANRIAQQQGGSKARKAARKLREFTERTYAFGDDFFKVTGYYIEMNKLLRDSPNMTKAEAADIAASRVRNGYPTYSMIPRNIKKLRRFPLSGMFVSFPYEVYRTTANNLRFIAEDLVAGRVRMASERLLGMTVANGLGFSLFNYSKDIFGYDDEDVDAIRALGSKHSANSRPMFLPQGEDGAINYLDMRSFLPQEQIWAPVMTLLGEGDPTDETFMEQVNTAIGEVLSPFTAADATSKFAFEIFNNQRVDTGRPIYYYDQDKTVLENILENDEEITKYLMRGVGPGVYNNLVDFLRANEVMPEVFGTKETPYKEFTNADAILALLGFRVQTLNLKTGTIQAIHEETMDLNGYINFHLTKSDINLWTRQDPEYLSKIGFEYADKQYGVAKRIMKMVNFAVKSNMTKLEFVESLMQSGVSKADAGLVFDNVVKGENKPLSPKLITKAKFKDLYNYIKDSHRGTKQELQEKIRNAAFAVSTFNLNVIEKWKTYFPEYDLKNDKENFEFYQEANRR